MKSGTEKKRTLKLTGNQQSFLRGLGHSLAATMQIGREGFSENLAETARNAFNGRELLKVRLNQNCSLSPEEAAARLSDITGAALVQSIGRTLLLYLPNPKLKPDKRIVLPE